MKIIFLGDSGIGKTKILMNYLDRNYDNIPTNGVEYYHNNNNCFYDSGGVSRLYNIIKTYLTDMDLIIIVYKYNQFSTWTNFIPSHKPILWLDSNQEHSIINSIIDKFIFENKPNKQQFNIDYNNPEERKCYCLLS